MSLNLNIKTIPEKFKKGVSELKNDLNIVFSDSGVSVSAKQGETFAVDFNGKNLDIVYKFDSEFYRALSLLCANGCKPFNRVGNRYFNDFGVHRATTARYSPNLSCLKKLLRKLALLGFSQFELYMQSNFELDGELYFGYAGGKYSQKELKELADYGKMLGVELVPCLETLAHQPELKRWQPYSSLYDWDDIFNVGREEVYALIEKMIATCAKCFYSKTINLGMDEAYLLGHGQYFRDNGLKPRIDIFLNHLSRVVNIAQKYGYTEQIIWSDMLYSTFNDYFYRGPNKLPQDVVDRIPKSVTLCYWDYYGTDNDHYTWCMQNHLQTGRKVLFGGGVWNWYGTISHNRFSMQILEYALGICKQNGVNNLLITSWGLAPLLYLLPSLCFASVFAYGENKQTLKPLFKTVMGCEFDDFMLLDTPNYISHDQCYVTPVADQVLYNDYFLGLMDSEVKSGASAIWLDHIKALENAKPNLGEYVFAADKAIALCKICYLKYELGVKTRAAYRALDKKTLGYLIENNYKPLIALYKDYFAKRETEWNLIFKSTAFESEVAAIGAMILRTEQCINRLTAFINGDIDEIEELNADVLDIKGNGKNFDFSGYPSNISGFKNVFSPNV